MFFCCRGVLLAAFVISLVHNVFSQPALADDAEGSSFSISIRASQGNAASLRLRGEDIDRTANFSEGLAVLTGIPGSLDSDFRVLVEFTSENAIRREILIPSLSRVLRTQNVRISLDFFSPPVAGGANAIISRFPPEQRFHRYISARLAGTRLMRQIDSGNLTLGRNMAELVGVWYSSFFDILNNGDTVGNFRVNYDRELYKTVRCFEDRRVSWLLQRYAFVPIMPSSARSLYDTIDGVYGLSEFWWRPACKNI